MTRKPASPATVDAIVQPLSKSQIEVLGLLTRKWTLDRHGKDGMQGLMAGPSGETRTVSAKTVSFLFAEGLITTSGYISDFEITDKGRSLVG